MDSGEFVTGESLEAVKALIGGDPPPTPRLNVNQVGSSCTICGVFILYEYTTTHAATHRIPGSTEEICKICFAFVAPVNMTAHGKWHGYLRTAIRSDTNWADREAALSHV